MVRVIVSRAGQIEIPKTIREALNLSAGTRMTLEVRGQDIVLSKESPWRKLRGAGADRDVMSAFAAFKGRERAGS